MIPTRIQRKRTKDWKMPSNTLYCGRPTMWGNPYSNVTLYRKWLLGNIDNHKQKRDNVYKNIVSLLKYDYLACWCPLTKECHVDILIYLLNNIDDWGF